MVVRRSLNIPQLTTRHILQKLRCAYVREIHRLDDTIVAINGGSDVPASAPKPSRASRWTEDERHYLERNIGLQPYAVIASALGRTTAAVKTTAQRLGMTGRSSWSDAEREVIRSRHAAGDTAQQILTRLPGRTLTSVYQVRWKLGLAKKKRNLSPQLDPFIREYHAQQYSDSEIEHEWSRLRAGDLGPVSRSFVSERRRAIGLPQNGVHTERFSRRAAAKTREQLAKVGLPSIGYLRVEAFKKFARDSGWPDDLMWRETQILNAIWERGPMTRREIADTLGMPWKGSRKSLHGNGPGGSYLATLMRRGLVVKLGKVVRSPECGKGHRAGQGKNVNLYSLAIDIQRRVPTTNQKEQSSAHERQPAFFIDAQQANAPSGGIPGDGADGTPAVAQEHSGCNGQFDTGRGPEANHERAAGEGEEGRHRRSELRVQPGAQAGPVGAASGHDHPEQLLRHACRGAA